MMRFAKIHRPGVARDASERSERERGQALVELALVLPVFLLLLLGIVQFGSVFRDYIALTDATRVGARQAAISRSVTPVETRDEKIIARVHKAGVNLDAAKMNVTVTLEDPVSGESLGHPDFETSWQPSADVTVYAEYPFKVNLFGMVFHTGMLKSRTTERIE